MRTLDPDLAAHLDGGTTTLCRCWRLIRPDWAVLGFTDHDADIVFGGTTFRAASGLEAAEATAELGFAVGGGDVSGALSDAGLTADDLSGGLYDNSRVETWLVNWNEPAQRLLLDVGVIGEVRRADAAFVAELRGLAHRLDEERGRVYAADCAADLGDARCGVNLTLPAWRGTGTVTDADGRSACLASGLSGFSAGLFAGGRLTWLTGANAGRSVPVRSHALAGAGAALALWEPAASAIAPGDTFHVTAGCDKSFGTCRGRFGNGANFRGFPHLPGNDVMIRYAREGQAGLDGGSLLS